MRLRWTVLLSARRVRGSIVPRITVLLNACRATGSIVPRSAILLNADKRRISRTDNLRTATFYVGVFAADRAARIKQNRDSRDK